MTRLCSRVQELEATVFAPTWGGIFAEVQNLALSKLPPADRDSLQTVIARRHGASKIDFRGALWSRWEHAFAQSVAETRCPFALTAMDMML
jgi:hypothetical protein